MFLRDLGFILNATMPKLRTSPYLFDEQKCLSIIKLREWGYLENDIHKSGQVTWTTNGVETSSLNLTVTMNHPDYKAHLNYSYSDKSVSYSVDLVSVPSNIGNGLIWYFLCPFTGKRCRKLHLIDGKFQHRSAIPGGMYSKQCQSKQWRGIEKVYGCYFDEEKNCKELRKKYFKKYYNGKPTKKYMKLKREIDRAHQFTAADINNLLMM